MFYSEVKVRRADQIFMNVAFCLLIICPVIVLSLVDNTVAKLSIVVGFYVLGSILLALGTGSSNPALAVLAACVIPFIFPRFIIVQLQHANVGTDMLRSLYSLSASG